MAVRLTPSLLKGCTEYMYITMTVLLAYKLSKILETHVIKFLENPKGLTKRKKICELYKMVKLDLFSLCESPH